METSRMIKMLEVELNELREFSRNACDPHDKTTVTYAMIATINCIAELQKGE